MGSRAQTSYRFHFSQSTTPNNIFGMHFSTFQYLLLQSHNFSAPCILVSLFTLNSLLVFPLLSLYLPPSTALCQHEPIWTYTGRAKCFSHSFKYHFFVLDEAKSISICYYGQVSIFSRFALRGQESQHKQTLLLSYVDFVTIWKGYSKGIKLL